LKVIGKEINSIKTTLREGYHTEIDDSTLCTEDDPAKYRSIVGFCIWKIVLGRFDVAYANSDMDRFNMLAREGHLKTVKRILSFGRVIIDTSYTDHSVDSVEDHSN
jgi:hypothetical protein